MSFIDQLPVDSKGFFEYGLGHGPGYGEMYMWRETITIDDTSFEVSLTAHSDIWSGFGDKMDPKNHLGPQFSINCRESEPSDEDNIKAKCLRKIRRKRGMRHFELCNLGTLNPSPMTLPEAREVFDKVIRSFLSGQLGS